jgi:hypothetical protein
MPGKLARTGVPGPRRLRRINCMAFPRELRQAIPDLHAGRVLELDSINGRASSDPLFGKWVELKLLVKETGKLKGEFVITMSLQPEAAQKLAATLTQLADQAEPAPPAADAN